MRNKFKEYYRPTGDEFRVIWDNSLFVFDTNMLLHIYRYSEPTRSLFVAILQMLNERIWIPYRIGYEFYRQRLSVIKEKERAYEDIRKQFKKMRDGFKKNLDDKYKLHPYVNRNELMSIIDNCDEEISKYLDEKNRKHPKLTDNDPFLELITDVFDGKVGQDFDSETLKTIIHEGKERYHNDIPPGYKDHKGKNKIDEFGDLILWYQIIEKAEVVKRPIIFVTDDTKEDWWEVSDTKTIGPRPELRKEIKSKAGVDFHMYDGTEFIKWAKEYLEIEVSDEAVEETKKVREEEEKIGKVWISDSELAKDLSQSLHPISLDILRVLYPRPDDFIAQEALGKVLRRHPSELLYSIVELIDNGLVEQYLERIKITKLGDRILELLNRRGPDTD